MKKILMVLLAVFTFINVKAQQSDSVRIDLTQTPDWMIANYGDSKNDVLGMINSGWFKCKNVISSDSLYNVILLTGYIYDYKVEGKWHSIETKDMILEFDKNNLLCRFTIIFRPVNDEVVAANMRDAFASNYKKAISLSDKDTGIIVRFVNFGDKEDDTIYPRPDGLITYYKSEDDGYYIYFAGKWEYKWSKSQGN